MYVRHALLRGVVSIQWALLPWTGGLLIGVEPMGIKATEKARQQFHTTTQNIEGSDIYV
jgi:hypothetical protein